MVAIAEAPQLVIDVSWVIPPSSFLEHRDVVYQALENGEMIFPQVRFLRDSTDADIVAQAMLSGMPIVSDYGATGGTAFIANEQVRREVALARGEIASLESDEPLAPVSLVGRKEDFFKWIDMNRLHPDVVPHLQEIFNYTAGVTFVRFPANEQAQSCLGPSFVSDGFIQLFCVPDDDPLICALQRNNGDGYYAVRSSNMTGEKEETTAAGRVKYAWELGAPIVVYNDLESYIGQLQTEHDPKKYPESRKRIGSQPIIQLPTNDQNPAITIVRSANTNSKSMELLLRLCTLGQITVIHQEEKQPGFKRTGYMPLLPEDVSAEHIRKELLEAAGL